MPKTLATTVCLLFFVALTGCAARTSLSGTGSGAAAIAHTNGSIHGGQQPVGGVAIQLYEVASTGYFASAKPLLAEAVISNANGNFTLPNNYTCDAGTQVYVVGTGGNPGLGAGTNNSALALMAGIGSCSYLLQNRNSLFFSVNEVTTVAATWSLARFMSSPTNAGTTSTNATGLANAFANIANVVNLASGRLPGTTLPAGATLPTAEIYTLADILASCVNTDGNLNSGSSCSLLFAAATPPGGATPGDTVTAALNIARNPTVNVTDLYNLAYPTSPFQPTLSSPPNNWLIGIHYTGGGLAQPAALAVDGAGNIWTANPGNNSVSEFSSTGAAVSPSSGFTDTSLANPSAIAIDSSGKAWAANAGGNSVTGFTTAGTVSGTFATNISSPNGIAFDGSGNGWVLSPGTSTLVEFGSKQSFLQQIPLSASPLAIAINPK